MVAPLCRYCGKPIPKHTRTVFVRSPGSNLRDAVQGPLYSKADCQRMVNEEVVSVSYGPKRAGEKQREVWTFGVWDGESYVDKYFCKAACASGLAYVLAKVGHCTKTYNAAIAAQGEKAA